MKVSWLRVIGGMAASLTFLLNVGIAGKHFFLRSRPPVRRNCPDSGIGIPKRDYYKSETRLQQSVIGTISADQPRTVTEIDPATQKPRELQRKQFRLERSKIAAGQIQLSRIGVAVDSSGQLPCVRLDLAQRRTASRTRRWQGSGATPSIHRHSRPTHSADRRNGHTRVYEKRLGRSEHRRVPSN